jgi:hypothetical protein
MTNIIAVRKAVFFPEFAFIFGLGLSFNDYELRETGGKVKMWVALFE